MPSDSFLSILKIFSHNVFSRGHRFKYIAMSEMPLAPKSENVRKNLFRKFRWLPFDLTTFNICTFNDRVCWSPFLPLITSITLNIRYTLMGLMSLMWKLWKRWFWKEKVLERHRKPCHIAFEFPIRGTKIKRKNHYNLHLEKCSLPQPSTRSVKATRQHFCLGCDSYLAYQTSCDKHTKECCTNIESGNYPLDNYVDKWPCITGIKELQNAINTHIPENFEFDDEVSSLLCTSILLESQPKWASNCLYCSENISDPSIAI